MAARRPHSQLVRHELAKAIAEAHRAYPDDDGPVHLLGCKFKIDGVEYVVKAVAHVPENEMDVTIEPTHGWCFTFGDPSPEWVKAKRPFSGII